MNFKRFAAVFRHSKVRMEYEIIGGKLYLMTPYMALIVPNVRTLPKCMEGLATPSPSIGDTKRRTIMLMHEKQWDVAVRTGILYQRSPDRAPDCVLQATDKDGKPYPVFLNSVYLDLAPQNPDLIATSGRTGIVMVKGGGETVLILPINYSQRMLVNMMGTVNTVCNDLIPEESGTPAVYVKLDDVNNMIAQLRTVDIPDDREPKELWDSALFQMSAMLEEIPATMFYSKEKKENGC